MMEVYRELYEEFINTPDVEQHTLWNLTAAEIAATNEQNERIRIQSELEQAVLELFDFEKPFDLEEFCTGARGGFDRTHERAFNTLGLRKYIEQLAGIRVEHRRLEHLLRRLLPRWMEEGKPIKGNYTIKDGQLMHSHLKFWIMPPKRKLFS
jgi:hypothetical protein